MPRVLMSINAAWNVVNFRAALVRALSGEDGHQVIAAVPDDGALDKVAALGARPVALAMTSGSTSIFGDLALFWRYLRLMRRERPDIYLGWTIKPNTYGSLAARLCGVPRINNISGLGTAFIRTGWLTRIASALYRLGLGGSSTVFFQNADDAALFRRLGLVRQSQIVLLPGSGIDLAHYDPTRFPPRAPDGEFRFLLIARLIRDKGVHEFVAAARLLRARHPHLRWQLLGFLDVDNRTAIDRATLDGWVAEELVEYLGAAEDVRGHIAAADCIVLPSYREGLSRVLLEAAAMERPAIASDVPGCRDVVCDGETGLLCQVQDAASLAEAMTRMAALPEAARAAMGRAARVQAGARFSEGAVIAAYRTAIAQALGR
ncbi:MAG: glycosyltransferase family 4 protein [Sphingomonadales bacterium]|nr:glycosyltransferase family 4 protein [Sphingomonadales bacterium]